MFLCKFGELVGCFRCSSIPIGPEHTILNYFTCGIKQGKVREGRQRKGLYPHKEPPNLWVGAGDLNK